MSGEDIKAKIEALEAEMASPTFWNDKHKAQAIIKEIQDLKEKLEGKGKYDKGNAIITIFSGAGGDDAEDFSRMLVNMYMRYIEKRGWGVMILHQNENDHGGYRNITFEVEGKNAYGTLKYESGVHRVQRVPITEAQGRIHTSAVTVAIMPEAEEVDVLIDPKDLRIDVYRSTGHGGQSVNTTDSAVRLTHLPTKITVSVQNERSQLQNRETAMKILKMKLKKIEVDSKAKKERDIKGGHTSAEWGNQIRSYVLQPYQQVKDHRTSYEEPNPEKVLSGELDGFIDSYLRFIHK